MKFYLENEIWKHKLVPVELSNSEYETTIDLLIYKNHYVLIKKLYIFIGNSKCKFICRRCLSCFEHEHVLKKHKDRCEQQDFTAIKLSLDKQLNWKKHYQKVPLYFRIYADFECNNSPVDTNIGEHTTNIYKQNPVCNGYYIVSDLPSVLQSGYVSNFGPNNVDWFVDEIIKLENKMNFYFKNTNVELNMLPEDEYNFENSDKCWFCELPFESTKVRDHCHLTGKYRGAAHESCNINVKKQQSGFIPVMFHNFSKYDCHLFFKTLLSKSKSQKLKVIPKTNEDYISVNFGCIRFIDSYRFLQSSLDSLVKSLQADLVLLNKEFPENVDLLNKKLAYPYEYFNSFEDYDVPFDSLSKESYYSKLTNSYPKDEEIERTDKIIDVFGVKNGKELTELYLKTDVILLADVFEKFINVSVKEFGINPLYSVSLPGYTWQCGLKYTNVKLDTLQDKDMILLLENNIRGGISSVMGDRYVKSDDHRKILYIDANNLYGYAMSQSLPYKDLKFDSIDIETILSTPDDSEIGYFVEVDLKYPDEIKDKTKNFPFCPENKFSPIDNFTDYMDSNKPESYVKCRKLICDWTDKQKYLVHYRLLKFYVKHGMENTKVHEVISFKQSCWLEKYIDYNTQKRNKTNDDFEKDFYKLLNNAFYGKTMENVRNRIRVEFLKNNENEKIVKWQSKLSFNGIHKSYTLGDVGYSSFTFKQTEVLMDKPIYLGFAVLDLSKLLMYETYYEKLQPYFGLENIQNHYTDCDSMVLSIKTDDIISDLKNLEDLFDFSNLNPNNELFSNKNKKVLGKFKIETPESI